MSGAVIAPLGTETADRGIRVSSAPIVLAAKVLLLIAACYLGQRLAIACRFPSVEFSTIWFPGGIVLAVFLLTPRREWLAYGIGAVLGASLGLPNDFSLASILIGPVLSIALRALLADVLLRVRMPAAQFDRLDRVLIYLLLAGLFFPGVFAFLTSWLTLLTGSNVDFWLLWRMRFLSGLDSNMTITPAVVAIFTIGNAKPLHAPLRRYVEACALGLVMLVWVAISFRAPAPLPMLALTVVPLALSIWAAARFEPGMTALVLLATVWASTQNALLGRSPFFSGSPGQNMFALQLYLAAISAPLLFLAALIGERKNIETALRTSERRYRAVVESQSELVCRYLPDSTLTFVNEAYCKFFSRRREELIGTKFIKLIPESARAYTLNFSASLARDKGTKVCEHEVLLPDGRIGWQQWVDQAICGTDGQVQELQGIGRDITDRKRAEDLLQQNESILRESYQRIQDLTGKLITAQEAERTRIARELHDGVNQRLAVLSISLSNIKRKLPESAVESQQAISRLQGEAMQLAEELRNLSHELHPGVLRHLGLVPALRAYCDEFRQNTGIEAELEVSPDSLDIPPVSSELSLCLYRVAQEALRNVARHACAQRVCVTIGRNNGDLTLGINDDGRGFDPMEARAAAGLGLLSIDERVRLMRGSVTIHSRPQTGTRLHVQIPLKGHDYVATETIAG